MSILPSPSLKWALAADAAVSGAVAVLQLTAAKLLAAHAGFSVALLRGTGLFLLGYVALLLALRARARLDPSLIWFVIVGNVAWALAALALGFDLPLSDLGRAFAMVHAVAVSGFAALELQGLRRSERVGRLAGA
jgi:hypothetical protein